VIPNTAHFIWIGEHFHWIYGLAVRSAALYGGFDKVILHRSHDISGTSGYSLLDISNIELRMLDPELVFSKVGRLSQQLIDVYHKLKDSAALSNVIRAAVLADEGGVYIDTDTVTIRPFTPLLNSGVFCGSEHIVFPGTYYRSWNPIKGIKALLLTSIRDFYRRIPNGWKHFRKIEKFYGAHANNAVIGSEPDHPFVLDLLQRIANMPEKWITKDHALGTHLIQFTAADYKESDLVIHPPSRFYAIGPEISEHWFRHNNSTSAEEAIFPDTVLIHWYSSGRLSKKLAPALNEEYVRQHASDQMFSQLAMRFLPDGMKKS
jgi:hypothetical protein